MNQNKKMNRSLDSKKTILMIIASLLVLFTLYQYYEYKHRFDLLDNIVIVPSGKNEATSDHNVALSPYWKYFQVKGLNGAQVIELIDIYADPEFEYKVYTGIPEKIRNEVFENTRQRMKKESENSGLTEREIDLFVDTAITTHFARNDIIIERVDRPLKSNTDYTILFKYKKWNIFNKYFAQNKDVRHEFRTSDEKIDQIMGIKMNFEAAVSAYTLFGNEKFQDERKKKYEACPFLEYSISIDFIMKNQLDTGDFKVGYVDCPYERNKEGGKEQVHVVIHNYDFQKGKNIFKKYLMTTGFQEGENLEVVYTHEPK